MKRIIALCCTFVGTVIGAGFASGQEIALFFGKCSIFSVLAAGLFLGAFCYVFLRLGSLTDGKVFSVFGKFSIAAKIIVIIANLSVFCATLAGSELVVYNLFSFHGGCIITAFFVLIVVICGINKIKILNVTIVPIIIILVLIIFFRDKQFDLSGKNSIVMPFCYASMNIVTSGFFLSSLSKDLTKKDCVFCASLSFVVLTVLLFSIYCPTKNVSDKMPLIAKATSLNLATIGNVILYLAMFTTLIGTLCTITEGKIYLTIGITIVGLAVAPLGFAEIVNNVYPLLGAAGGVITLSACILLIIKTKSSRYYNRRYL